MYDPRTVTVPAEAFKKLSGDVGIIEDCQHECNHAKLLYTQTKARCMTESVSHMCSNAVYLNSKIACRFPETVLGDQAEIPGRHAVLQSRHIL